MSGSFFEPPSWPLEFSLLLPSSSVPNSLTPAPIAMALMISACSVFFEPFQCILLGRNLLGAGISRLLDLVFGDSDVDGRMEQEVHPAAENQLILHIRSADIPLARGVVDGDVWS